MRILTSVLGESGAVCEPITLWKRMDLEQPGPNLISGSGGRATNLGPRTRAPTRLRDRSLSIYS